MVIKTYFKTNQRDSPYPITGELAYHRIVAKQATNQPADDIPIHYGLYNPVTCEVYIPLVKHLSLQVRKQHGASAQLGDAFCYIAEAIYQNDVS